jgi:hypothetical protein
MVRAARRGAAAVPSVALAIALLGGCGGSPREIPIPDEDLPPRSRPVSDVPDAFSLRFEHVEGTGFSREGWDLEILQVGADIRVRGGVRSAGSYVPVFRAMDASEFVEIWQWVRAFPLDGFRAQEDSTVDPPGWRKTLRYDAVLDADSRELSDNRWTRPLTDAGWVAAVEDRLHLMVLELAGRELDRGELAPPVVADTAGVLRKTLEALGEIPASPDSL